MSNSTPGTPLDLYPRFNKSPEMNSILQGCSGAKSSHFADELERFQRDFATYHQGQKQATNQRKKQTIAKKQQQRQMFIQNLQTRTMEVQKKKQMQQVVNLHLFDVGQKRNGMTGGVPINPVNHQYSGSYGGKQLQRHESQKNLTNMVRLHHLQSKNTCGYNPLNGKQNTPIQSMVPRQQQQVMNSRLQEYQQHYSLRPPYF